MAYRVFISYSTKDLAVAAQAKQMLEQVGVEVFLAEYSLDPGSDLGLDIIRQIQTCDLFLLLWSKNARESEWVTQEIGAAFGRGKPTIPVVLDEGELPPGFLRRLKYLPAFKDLGQALRWLQKNITDRATKKAQATAVLVGVGAVLLWLAATEKR